MPENTPGRPPEPGQTGEPPGDEPVGKPSEEEIDPDEGRPAPPFVKRRPIPPPVVQPRKSQSSGRFA